MPIQKSRRKGVAWIESHQTLGRHPKTGRLARALDIIVPTVVGHLQFLWWWALDFASDGDLSSFLDTEIAEGASWKGDATVFVAALIASGFVDDSKSERRLHDWDDYAGRLIAYRKSNAAKQKRYRERNRNDEVTLPSRNRNVTDLLPARNRNVTDLLPATVPNRTVPDQTVPDLEISKDISIAPNGAIKTSAPKKKREPTENDRLTEEIISLGGKRPSTKAEWVQWSRNIVQLKDADPPVRLEELSAIIANYRQRCPGLPINPGVLARHLSDYRDVIADEKSADGDASLDLEAQQKLGWNPWQNGKYIPYQPHSEPTNPNERSSEPV